MEYPLSNHAAASDLSVVAVIPASGPNVNLLRCKVVHRNAYCCASAELWSGALQPV